jgi:hypothetical protein
VSLSLDIGILRWFGAASFAATTTTAPPWPSSRRGRIPRAPRARNGYTTALLACECQSFLDNVIAGFGSTGSWNDPCLRSRGVRLMVIWLQLGDRSVPFQHALKLGFGSGMGCKCLLI